MPAFELPNSTRIPDDLLDKYMREMSHPEFKVVMAIARATIGYRRPKAILSRREIASITGLSRDAADRALEDAQKHGYVALELSVQNGAPISCWTLNLRDDVAHRYVGAAQRGYDHPNVDSPFSTSA